MNSFSSYRLISATNMLMRIEKSEKSEPSPTSLVFVHDKACLYSGNVINSLAIAALLHLLLLGRRLTWLLANHVYVIYLSDFWLFVIRYVNVLLYFWWIMWYHQCAQGSRTRSFCHF